MSRIRGAIFDLDGTLLDSMGIWTEIDEQFLKKRGIDIPRDYSEKITAMSFNEIAEYTIELFSLNETPDELIAEWNEMSEYSYTHEIKLKPNAYKYLLKLKEQGIVMGIATALNPKLCEAVLRNNKIYELFKAVTFTHEVERGKSFPDIYLLAAEKIGIVPSECVVFEDISAGIEGAKLGGFKTCGVYDKHSEHETESLKANADCFIYNFNEIL